MRMYYLLFFHTFFLYLVYCSQCFPFLWLLILSSSSPPNSFTPSSCMYYLYMAAIDLYLCIFISLLAFICVDVGSTSIFYISCMNSFYFSSVLINWVPYFFPPNFILRRSTPFPVFYLLGIVLVLSCSLVSISLVSTLYSSLSTSKSWSLVSFWYSTP